MITMQAPKVKRDYRIGSQIVITPKA